MFFSTSDYDITKLKTGPAPCPMSTARLGELFPDFDVELLDESEEDPSTMDGLDRFTNPYNLLTPKIDFLLHNNSYHELIIIFLADVVKRRNTRNEW